MDSASISALQRPASAILGAGVDVCREAGVLGRSQSRQVVLADDIGEAAQLHGELLSDDGRGIHHLPLRVAVDGVAGLLLLRLKHLRMRNR